MSVVTDDCTDDNSPCDTGTAEPTRLPPRSRVEGGEGGGGRGVGMGAEVGADVGSDSWERVLGEREEVPLEKLRWCCRTTGA